MIPLISLAKLWELPRLPLFIIKSTGKELFDTFKKQAKGFLYRKDFVGINTSFERLMGISPNISCAIK